MNDNNKVSKRNIVLLASIIVILMGVVYGISYAYFTAQVTNTNTPTPTTVQTGTLEMKFLDGASYIDTDDLIIMTEAEAMTQSDNYSTFQVKNTGTAAAKYKLYLTDYSITTNLVNRDFKWKLTVGKNTYTGNFYDLFNGKTATDNIISSSDDDIELTSNYLNSALNGVDNCEFRVWLQETDQNQIGLTDGQFRGTIKLIALVQ